MDAHPHFPRPPLRHRLPPAARTALVWGSVVAFPVVLAVAVGTGAKGGVLLPALAMALPAALLRRRPLAVLALMLLGSLALTGTIHSWDREYLTDLRYLQLLAIDLAVGVVAATRPRPVSVVAAVVTLLVQIATGYLNPGHLDPNVRPEIPTLALVTAWTIGNSVGARRRYAEALRSHAATQAVIAERLRIARELHDMVAHSIGIIAIQAGAGSRVMDTRPAEARNALRAIEATSRETLAGLRRVLGGLRQTPAPGGTDPAPLGPAPGLADLDQLVATAAQAGVRVQVRRPGQPRPVPADIALAAFRVVQEAITNVVRHAGVRECQVLVDHRDAELCVEITDNGQGCLVAGDGYGIAGMRERVGLLHGEFSAGPRAEGGFRVAARLPLPEPAPVAPR